MTELRKVPFSRDYWHVLSDEHASIVGSLWFAKGARLPWRAEFTGTMNTGWPHLEVEHFKTEEEAMQFMREALEKFDG